MYYNTLIGKTLQQMATESFKQHHSVNKKTKRKKKASHLLSLCVVYFCSCSLKKFVHCEEELYESTMSRVKLEMPDTQGWGWWGGGGVGGSALSVELEFIHHKKVSEGKQMATLNLM